MIKIIDSHVHSDFSTDSNVPMEEIIKHHLMLGLDTVIFTDHVDYDYPDNIVFDIDFQKYTKHMELLRQRHRDIEILMGVEIGYQKHLNEKLNKLINSHPFDFVIASIHACGGKEFCNNGFFDGKTQKESYREYFEAVKYMVQNYDDYDVVGHLDFIVRYGQFVKKELKYIYFKDIIDEVLLTIIQKGKGIELNTSGLRYGLGIMHPSKCVLERYFELGGEIVTLGSDSHRVEDLFSDFNIAINDLKSIGFNRIAYFKERQPQFIEI